MNLTLWKHRNPITGDLSRIREEMDRTIERMFGGSVVESKMLRNEGWLPAIDVSENDTEVTVRAEVPGIAPDDLEVTVLGTTLSISGTKREKSEKRGEDFYQCERRFGAFRRVIELPESVDPDKVTAETDQGVVCVHIGKRAAGHVVEHIRAVYLCRIVNDVFSQGLVKVVAY